MSRRPALGDWVIAKVELSEIDPDGDLLVYARPGAVGHVIDLRPGFLPTIAWERTGTVCDADESEFDVLCGADFARTPETTPRR